MASLLTLAELHARHRRVYEAVNLSCSTLRTELLTKAGRGASGNLDLSARGKRISDGVVNGGNANGNDASGEGSQSGSGRARRAAAAANENAASGAAAGSKAGSLGSPGGPGGPSSPEQKSTRKSGGGQVRYIQKFFTHHPVSTLDRVPFQLTDELFLYGMALSPTQFAAEASTAAC